MKIAEAFQSYVLDTLPIETLFARTIYIQYASASIFNKRSSHKASWVKVAKHQHLTALTFRFRLGGGPVAQAAGINI